MLVGNYKYYSSYKAVATRERHGVIAVADGREKYLEFCQGEGQGGKTGRKLRCLEGYIVTLQETWLLALCDT